MATTMLAFVISVALLGPLDAAQGGQANQAGRGRQGMELPAAAPGMPVQQLQELFDAFVLVQAQRVLQLTDDEYQRFFPAMKRLQDVRRGQVQQRVRQLNELRRAAPLRPGPNQREVVSADEATLTAMLRRMDEMEARHAEEIRDARKALDAVLTVRQRAAFRIFEEDMERQKIDFITRARQQAGPGRQGGG
ncbi:MAG: hypothetical protein AB7L71_09440 [Vicinamibacterales bacterium]|jgi:ketosteroid isomerase-like protein